MDINLKYRSVRRVLLITMAVDFAFACIKIWFGYAHGSLGMISDGFHSLLHGAGSIIGLIGITLATRPPDKDHPYGYDRYEPLASMGIAVFMFFMVWNIISNAVSRTHSASISHVNSTWGFIILICGLPIMSSLSFWERKQGKRLNSSVLISDSTRLRADIWITIAVIVGLICILLGYPHFDIAVSLLVAGVIGWSAWKIIRGASRILSDAAIVSTDQIAEVARKVDGVIDCHNVRARGYGGMVRVDLHILVDPNISVTKSHGISKKVENEIRTYVGGIVEVLVHIGPARQHQAKEAKDK